VECDLIPVKKGNPFGLMVVYREQQHGGAEHLSGGPADEDKVISKVQRNEAIYDESQQFAWFLE